MTVLRQDLLNPTLKDTLALFQLDKNYISGKGSYLIDENGQRYLDFISQYGAVPFGYNPDFIWDCLREVREKALPSLVQPSLPGEALRLANQLAEVTPGDLCYCTFCQSGTEAVETAIKLVRSSTGRKIIVSAKNSFHGKTMGALSATGKESYQKPFYAPIPGFMTVPYNDVEALRRIFAEYGDDIAAFIVEPVQGEGGIIVAQPGYLTAAREICSTYGAALIVDEIQTGLGRCGKLFACEYEGIEPDILLLAKALGGGLLPLGVCISSPAVWNDDFGMLHSSTFANNNLTCYVGQAVLNKLLEEEGRLIEEVEAKGRYMLAKLKQLAQKYPDAVKEVRGCGLMQGVEFHDLRDCGSYDTAFIINNGGFTALVAGFLLNVYHVRLAPFLNDSMTLRLEPALTITYEEIDYVMEAVDVVCNIISKRDFAKFYQYLFRGDYGKIDKVSDYRPESRRVRGSELNEGEKPERKFAFVIHYPAPEDVVANNPSFKSFSRQELYRFMDWQKDSPGVEIVCHMPAIRSLDGSLAEGWLIGVPYGAREIMGLPRVKTAGLVAEAVDLAKELGAGIVGLGALTSVVTKGGRSVQGRGVAITSGNSFTTLMAMEALFTGAEKMHIDYAQARAAVIGATGSIGRACAMMLSEQLSDISLLGNPNRSSSARRMNILFADLLTYAQQRMRAGQLGGLSAWLNNIADILAGQDSARALELRKIILEGNGLSVALLEEICADLELEPPLKTSTSIDETLPRCDMIVAASNSPDYIIYPEHLKPGAVICDVARPADVSPGVFKERNDVLILEGGLVQYPDDIAFGPNLGYRDGVNLACLSETVLLALEGDYNDYSIGSKMPLETLSYLRELGRKHGLGLAGLKMNNQEINNRDIEAIYQRSIQLKPAENM